MPVPKGAERSFSAFIFFLIFFLISCEATWPAVDKPHAFRWEKDKDKEKDKGRAGFEPSALLLFVAE